MSDTIGSNTGIVCNTGIGWKSSIWWNTCIWWNICFGYNTSIRLNQLQSMSVLPHKTWLPTGDFFVSNPVCNKMLPGSISLLLTLWKPIIKFEICEVLSWARARKNKWHWKKVSMIKAHIQMTKKWIFKWSIWYQLKGISLPHTRPCY